MSIRGEMVMALERLGMPRSKAREAAHAALDAALDPNWAQRFADERASGDPTATGAYFEVIRFLKEYA